ncbi:MAG TPA: hypothetical protein VNG91_07480 [Terriglobia bacterium]|nr:hypothetical protein [Terriglobia bacterium]
MVATIRVPDPEPGRKVEVEWTTVRYRTIAFYAVLGLIAAGFVFYLIAPNYFTRKAKRALHTLTAGVVENNGTRGAPARREAHFVNLDGTVQIKKAQSSQWVRADYNTNLATGDFIQTGSNGVARIIFADGTSYVIKADSLIAVEESAEDPVTRATRVAVQVTSGAVDLSTGRYEVPGSTSRVAFADAMASLGEESRAVVRNDPQKNIHQITVNQGEANLTRGSTTVQLGQYEKVTFSAAQPGLLREKVIAPPSLTAPANMALTVVQAPRATRIEFKWSPVAGAGAYRLKISPSGMFSNLVVDRKVVGTSTEVSGLDEGVYYWLVTSIDRGGNESQASTPNRFDLVQQVTEGHQAFLEITNIIQHGRVIEVVGRTEPGSTVIINNQQVFNIAADGTFRHFTSPLPKQGSNPVTITAQDRKGNTRTIRKTVVIE